MLKNLGFVALLVFLSGCTAMNRQYSIWCDPGAPRNRCETSGEKSAACLAEQSLIKQCASYVSIEVAKLSQRRDGQGTEGTQESGRGIIHLGDQFKKPVVVDTTSAQGYRWGITQATYYVQHLILSYQHEVGDFLAGVRSGRISSGVPNVTSLSKIDYTRQQLLMVAAAGPNIENRVHAGLDPSAEVSRIAKEVVANTNPNDPVLSKAAQLYVFQRTGVSPAPVSLSPEIATTQDAYSKLADRLQPYTTESFDAKLDQARKETRARRQARQDKHEAEQAAKTRARQAARVREEQQAHQQAEDNKSIVCKFDPASC